MSSSNGHSSSLPDSPPKNADILILGAGVMGASIAFHLAKRKAGSIVIIDKDHVGRGGSGRSSALVRMHYSYPPEVQLALISLDMFQNWQEVVGQPGDFRKTGFVRIVHPNETERLKQNVEMQCGLGARVYLIDKHELQALEPDWIVDDVELAAYEPDSGYGDGAGVAGDFLGAAREIGAKYLSRTRATAFVVKAGHVRGVITDRGTISAPIVISATGPWTRPLFHQAGYDLPIECEYHQVGILRNSPDMKGGGSACIDSVTATYFRSDAHDKFLVGDFYGKRPIDPDNFPQRASDESLEEIIERACGPHSQTRGSGSDARSDRRLRHDARFAPSVGRNPGDLRAIRLRRILRHGIQDFPCDRCGHERTRARRQREDGGHSRVPSQPFRGRETDQSGIRIRRRLRTKERA